MKTGELNNLPGMSSGFVTSLYLRSEGKHLMWCNIEAAAALLAAYWAKKRQAPRLMLRWLGMPEELGRPTSHSPVKAYVVIALHSHSQALFLRSQSLMLWLR